jgi:hypothetical protein
VDSLVDNQRLRETLFSVSGLRRCRLWTLPDHTDTGITRRLTAVCTVNIWTLEWMLARAMWTGLSQYRDTVQWPHVVSAGAPSCSVTAWSNWRPRAGPRPLVTRPAKLFVSLLLVPTSWTFFFFAPKDLNRLLLYTQVPQMLLTDVSFPGKNCVRWNLLQEEF